MSSLKGKPNFDSLLATLPSKLEAGPLRGGVKAFLDVIADEARSETRSPEVRATIKTSVRSEPGLIVGKIQTKGKGAFLAPWEEYGTAPHFIAVDGAQSGGLTVRRLNSKEREGAMIINGNFVGGTVHHPGTAPHPFFRVAFDRKYTAGIEALEAHVVTKLTKAGLDSPEPVADEQ